MPEPRVDDAGSGLHWSLRPAWRLCDKASDTPRTCDALGRATRHRMLSTNGGAYWMCGETGQLHADHFVKADTSLYDDFWQKHIDSSDFAAEVKQHHKRVAQFAKYRKAGRLFEVASGDGSLLKAAIDQGWQVEGNDVSPVATAHAAKMTGATMHTGKIEAMQLEAGAFDVVICNNVFEHLDEPAAALANLANALRPGGVIYLHTLSAQSLSIYFRPREWHYFVPGHHYVPTLVSLAAYCERASLAATSVKTHGARLRAGGHDKPRSRGVKLKEKLAAAIAAPLKLGHRMECLLERQA